VDKEDALKILIANACCYTEKSCSNCPFEPQNGAKDDKDCDLFGKNLVIEAVKVFIN